jgi:hypothetical protein
MLILLCILAALACHRIWHYEDIFEPLRGMLPWKWLIDPAITPLFIAPLIGAVTLIPPPWSESILAVLACYPLLRGMVWVYQKYDPPAAVCSPCQQRKNDLEELSKVLRSFEKRVIVLGATWDELKYLAKKKPTYAIIAHQKDLAEGKMGRMGKNNIFLNLINADDSKTVNNLLTTIFHGGNATVVTINKLQTPLMKAILTRVGSMQAVAWLHVTDQPVTLPPHHRSVAPGTPLDTVIDTAQAYKPPSKT